MQTKPPVSVIVPAKNEGANLPTLLKEIDAAFNAASIAIEILVVDDGSDDNSLDVLGTLCKEHPSLRILSHPISAGQSAAIHSGVLAARAEIICTLDGDGQNPPDELPKIVAPLMAPGQSKHLGLVAGQRTRRKDTVSKKLASRFANALRGAVLKDNTRDTGCGLKAFYRQGFLELPYFNHMHRYLPALFIRAGYEIHHIDVAHRPRKAGQSNYSNFGRALAGLQDLIGVSWLIRRRKKTAAKEIERQL